MTRDSTRRIFGAGGASRVWGDGSQSKSHDDVHDDVSAVLLAAEGEVHPCRASDVARGDHITVAEIAKLAMEMVGVDEHAVIEYSGDRRGWKGDIPVMRLDTSRIRALRWASRRTSPDALLESLRAMLPLAESGGLN